MSAMLKCPDCGSVFHDHCRARAPDPVPVNESNTPYVTQQLLEIAKQQLTAARAEIERLENVLVTFASENLHKQADQLSLIAQQNAALVFAAEWYRAEPPMDLEPYENAIETLDQAIAAHDKMMGKTDV